MNSEFQSPGRAFFVSLFMSMLLGGVAGHFLLSQWRLGTNLGMMFGIGLGGLLSHQARAPFRILLFLFVLGAPLFFLLLWRSSNA
jgi:hypothetical protein